MRETIFPCGGNPTKAEDAWAGEEEDEEEAQKEGEEKKNGRFSKP